MLSGFIEAIKQDGRISVRHIAIYTVLLNLWVNEDFANPLYLDGVELSSLAKMSLKTYYRSLKELDKYGYVQYIPSFKKSQASKVIFPNAEKICCHDKKRKHISYESSRPLF